MEFALKAADLNKITEILKSCKSVKAAKIFGSRAMGNYKLGSDVDVAVFGENITFSDISQINYELNEEALMPYMFDVIHYDKLENQNLKRHIDEHGRLILLEVVVRSLNKNI